MYIIHEGIQRVIFANKQSQGACVISVEVKGFFRTSVILNQSLEKYIEQAGPFKQNILPSNHKNHENIRFLI